ncbi:hypothetical protein Patl1_18736 [Pistacia atlantica]|uniref:Uncharacterized protein n=1 Tax=Pistacia atlantica TaxID=434234 RepID=A0ACC1BZT4_9ROSI|nr:hypothetical protein Patl1_18736 [Pistacia atlantica]
MDIPKGMIIGIIGPSGSGKSTVLRALNRLWEPPSGTVFLDGRDIRDLDVLNLRRKVGMLFQTPVLFEGQVNFFLIIICYFNVPVCFFSEEFDDMYFVGSILAQLFNILYFAR